MPRKGEPCSVAGCDKRTIARDLCSTHYWRWWKHGSPLKLLKREQGAAHRFLLDTALTYDSDGCLIWPFNRNHDGRAYLSIDGRNRYAHRLVCEMKHGQPPTPDHEAAHSCGRGSDGCVSPHHLRWATHAENEADKRAHGTVNRGIRNGGAKLSDSEVLAIYEACQSRPQRAVAAQFGIAQQTVSKIARGEKWGWLTGSGSPPAAPTPSE